MNKSVAGMLVLFFLTASCIIVAKPVMSSAEVAENSWVSKAPMQVARSVLGVAAVNGKIYAIGGSIASGFAPSMPGYLVYVVRNFNGVGTNEEYDPATDTWVFKTPMPTPRDSFATAVYENKIYCIGGQVNGSFIGVNEVYNPAMDTWETKTPMPTARGWLRANVVDGRIYIIGGYFESSDGWAVSNLNEVYNPETDSWTMKTPIPTTPPNTAWPWVASVVFDSRIYFIGGLSKDQNYMNQIYDPENDTWSYGASPPLYGEVAGATTGILAPKRIYVFSSKGVGVYDPASDSWASFAEAPTRRYNFGVATVNDTLYAIGGNSYNNNFPLGDYAPVAVNEQYTPIGYGTPDPAYDGTAPKITVASPENKTYYTTNIPLNFSVNEPAFWMRYKLDNQTTTAISDNTTLTGLSHGQHNLTVYATDIAGNTGVSETINFTIALEPEPFPTTLVATASAVSVATVGLGLLVYFKKRKR